MKKTTYLILLMTILVNCTTMYFPTYNEDRVKYRTDSYGYRIIGEAPIMPDDSLSKFVNDWYSKHLSTLGEPVLYNKTDRPINIVRFTHLGTWTNPYSYRVEQGKSNTSITYNKTSGKGGYEPGIRIEHATKIINDKKWDLVISKMDSIDFWNMGTHDKNMILDGAEWIFEALINGRYHFVTRNSPDQYGGENYAELCNLIVQIYNEENSK